MKDLGSLTISTKRLILRKVKLEDLSQIFYNFASDESVTDNVQFVPPKSIDETEKLIYKWQKKYNNPYTFNWVIVNKNTLEVIGQICVVNKNITQKTCEIGYILGSYWWNKGFMSEACKAVVSFLLNYVGFEKIEAKHYSDNPNSGKVMQKAGLKYYISQKSNKLSKKTGQRLDVIKYYAIQDKVREQCIIGGEICGEQRD